MKIIIEKNKKKSKSKKSNPKKKKLEFAQKWLIGCIIISVVFTSMSYILSWFDKNPVESLSITIIQTLWSSTGFSFAGYTILNSVRAFTGSKYGIPNNTNITNIDNINTINDNLDQTNISLQNLGDFSAKNDINSTENDMNNNNNAEYNPQNNRGT